MNKPLYGYCALTADGLHIGHIVFLDECKNRCQKLIVGIMTDHYLINIKKRKALMNYTQREKLVSSLKMVYKTMPQDSFEYPHGILGLKAFYDYDFLIMDSDQHKREHSDILFPYMTGISSSKFKKEYCL
jgi:glycerol-3-phosphate cytidylyltransferase